MFSKDRRFKYGAGGLLLAGFIALFALITKAALAADAPATAQPPPQADCGSGHRGDMDLSKMDARAAKMFASVDTNGDGKITQAEFLAAKPPHGGPGGGPGPGMHGPGMAMGMGTGMGPGVGMGPSMGMGPGMMGMGHHGPDGGLTAQDREAFQADLFKALDADHNGQLSQAEFAKAWETAQTMMKTQMFKKLDKNGDGVLTKDEFPPFVAKMKAMDTNGDGTVTRDEMRAGRAASASPSQAPSQAPSQTPSTPPN